MISSLLLFGRGPENACRLLVKLLDLCQNQRLNLLLHLGYPSAHLLHLLRLSLAQVGGDRSFFSIYYYTGYLVSSARQLRAEDVVVDSMVLRKATTKTKRTRSVPLHPSSKLFWGRRGYPAVAICSPVAVARGRLRGRRVMRRCGRHAIAWACAGTAPTVTGAPGRPAWIRRG
jgi:integrase